MEASQIASPDRLEEALKSPEFLLFKHSNRCSISARAFRAYEEFLAGREGVATAWIDVVADRALSQRVAEATGVEHASPQALLLRAGAVAWSASHFDLTQEAFAAALDG